MGDRFDALFQLRSNGSVQAMEVIAGCLLDPSQDSALLKHELAYCIGQMQLKQSIPLLSQVLEKETEDTMVRHEAGEALGAVGDKSALEVLKKFTKHEERAIRETCELAIQRIEQCEKDGERNVATGGFGSIDPAVFEASSVNDDMGSSGDGAEDVDPLQKRLIDESLPLYDRYVAMFKLRNINTSKSVHALCKG